MPWEINLIIALQSIPGLTGVMQFFSFLGTEEFFLIFMPAVYWCVDSAIGARLAVVLLASNSLNGVFKLVFHLPRPYWVDQRVLALSVEATYGLPSGHAQNAVALWGLTATQIKQRAAWAVALSLIFLISLSRLYLGMHFPLDVMGGWLLGGMMVWATLKAETRVRAWWAAQTLPVQLGAAFALSLVYLLLVALTLTLIAGTPDPAAWGETARAAVPAELAAEAYGPRIPEGAVTSAGLLFGLGTGLTLMGRYARFDARGAWAKRVLRFSLGIVVTLVLWLGLKAIFPAEPFWLGMTLRYIRYALTVVWVLYLAPLVFMRFGLAEKQA